MHVTLQRQYVGDVLGCPRCGGDHTGIYFAPMGGSDELWANCPENMQPILTSVDEAEDGGVADLLARYINDKEEA